MRRRAAVARDARELPLELRLAERDEPVGIERGIRGQRADLAVRRVDRDDGAGVGARRGGAAHALRERLLGRPLGVEVDREAHVAAGHGRLDVPHRAGRLAERVDGHGIDAVGAAQERVVAPLDPALADHVAPVVVVEARILQLLGPDLAELPVDVRAERAVRVEAQGHLCDREPVEDRRVLLQVPLQLHVDVGRERDRSDRIHAQLAVDALPQRARLEVEHVGHAQQQLMAPRGVAHGARVEVELVGDAVAHEHAALVVEDLAARRAHDDLLLVVARRLRHERARVEHLQRPQAQYEQHEQDDDSDAQRTQPEPQAPVRAEGRARIRRWLRHRSP